MRRVLGQIGQSLFPTFHTLSVLEVYIHLLCHVCRAYTVGEAYLPIPVMLGLAK